MRTVFLYHVHLVSVFSNVDVVDLVDVLGFFYSTLPPEGELSLDELHLIVRDIWLTRFDKDLEQERAKRRKGRPKSAKEIQIDELKVREAEEYRTGLGSSPFFSWKIRWNLTQTAIHPSFPVLIF